MKRSALIRILCAVMCVAMFISAFSGPMLVSAAAADSDIVTVPDSETLEADALPELDNSGIRGIIGKALDFLFSNFGFIGFIFDPYQFTIINQKPVFQWALGFNDLYDVFTWVVNVWADSFKCEFNYEGKDWRIQFWKGGYGVFFATGGEIGIYNKSENIPLEHYNCPLESDWLYLTYTMYNKGEKLYTRPSPYMESDDGPYWWAPGYKVLSICTDFLSNPRSNVIMDAEITFKSVEMANAFVEELKAKGFTLNTDPENMNILTPENYAIKNDGLNVHFIWQNYTESLY